ncbi:Glutamate receptor 2.2 [Thalictrum thalictroides]|uniref:Glutamate receptor n=1 Tax=Thalictrum thalictroides TaxID=46969 RepID=A0A7J6VKY6_THATH|nr:Glutamate receptor 2.2 [Thalictrum thalictroides]
MELINEKKAGVVLGLRMCDEVAFIAELGDTAQVPILSFADTIPSWASKKWPFLLQAIHNQYKQIHVVAAIVGTWHWRKINFIYEDTGSATFSILPYLIDALQEVGSSVDNMVPLTPLTSLFEVLEKLKRQQCKVFIVHTSLSLAQNIFLQAEKLSMMETDTVWITTTSITDHFDFLNSSVMSTMQGVLGVMTYYPQTGAQFKDFNMRFQRRYRLEHPEEFNSEPGIFALQAYDAVRAVALAVGGKRKAINMSNLIDQTEYNSSINGKELLQKILESNIKGLTGEFLFAEGLLSASNIFQIVNVVGRTYTRMGFWSEGLGFSRNILNERPMYNISMQILGQVVWPGGSSTAPRGWALPTSENPLLIGVPDFQNFKQFVNVRHDVGGVQVHGYSIDVFKAVVNHLPYHLPYKFIPYNGTYNSLVEQIYYKNFDAVVGDVTIVSKRCDYAEFSHPYTDSGVQIVVLRKSHVVNRSWLFLKPFTIGLWGLTACVNIYNGVVVWLVERRHHPEFNGSAWDRVGSLTMLTFTTLFALQGERLHSNLSRMTMLVWLFVAIVIIQSYTASLTSMLTVPRLQNSLDLKNSIFGCPNRGTFIYNFLKDSLGVPARNIRTFMSLTDYAQAFMNKEITAAILEVPYMKLFLAEYCKDFVVVGETYNLGGFGFVFPKGSPILPDISKAVLEVTETGQLLELEHALISSYNCSDSDSHNDSLGVTSFLGLFYITGATTTLTLVLYLLRSFMASNYVAKSKYFKGSKSITQQGKHDPDIDEWCMFAAEMEMKLEKLV